jgi:hypothetical protein
MPLHHHSIQARGFMTNDDTACYVYIVYAYVCLGKSHQVSSKSHSVSIPGHLNIICQSTDGQHAGLTFCGSSWTRQTTTRTAARRPRPQVHQLGGHPKGHRTRAFTLTATCLPSRWQNSIRNFQSLLRSTLSAVYGRCGARSRRRSAATRRRECCSRSAAASARISSGLTTGAPR